MELKPHREAVILIAEDNPDDVELLRVTFRLARIVADIHFVCDGEECLKFLDRRAPYQAAPRPDLILLDINMPRRTGIEVLRYIKNEASPELRRIPVVVLTTSDSDVDVLKAYELHANAFIVKPVLLDDFIRATQSLAGFFLKVVTLASK